MGENKKELSKIRNYSWKKNEKDKEKYAKFQNIKTVKEKVTITPVVEEMTNRESEERSKEGIPEKVSKKLYPEKRLSE